MEEAGSTTTEGAADSLDDDLAVFVDRLAAAGSDRQTAQAKAQIRRGIAEGSSPPGLRRLAEALAASVAELPPPPRRPSDDSGSVVAAMHENALVVLEDFGPDAVAGAVAALIADGRRVVVTAPTPAELAAVRDALPPATADSALDQLPPLSPAEFRELRMLVATSTPARRARAAQQLPAREALPALDEVADLCGQAERTSPSSAGAGMIYGMLDGLDPDRRAAVISVANIVTRSLAAMRPRTGREWEWGLLGDLIYSRHRAVFDRLLEDTAQAVAALERARRSRPVEIVEALPPGAGDMLRRYRAFLEGGGRSRSYFRSPAQREVAPLLRMIRVAGRAPETADDVNRVLEHMDLGERLVMIDSGCAAIDITPPSGEPQLLELADGLVRVAAAARSVGALRHDVLFLAENSPLSVPDIATAERVAGAILDYAEHGSSADAEGRLDRMADTLAAGCPVSTMAPEHELAVAALRNRDVEAYAAALEAFVGARHEVQDDQRHRELLRRLGEGAPRLADWWSTTIAQDPSALGVASFVPMDKLLVALPPADTADAVLVVGAGKLGVERLLLTAVAPRMIAAVAPGERPESSPSLLSVLQRASALVIRGRSGEVVHLATRNPGTARVG